MGIALNVRRDGHEPSSFVRSAMMHRLREEHENRGLPSSFRRFSKEDSAHFPPEERGKWGVASFLLVRMLRSHQMKKRGRCFCSRRLFQACYLE